MADQSKANKEPHKDQPDPKNEPNPASPSSHQAKPPKSSSSHMVTTYSASGKNAYIPPIPVEDRTFTKDEIKNLAGELQPGEVGWVELDEEGTPTGPARKEPPPPGTPTAKVVGTLTTKMDEITTPTGAPITKHMNPDPELWDAGMLARNPPPEETEEQKKSRENLPLGAPVVNQPVTG